MDVHNTTRKGNKKLDKKTDHKRVSNVLEHFINHFPNQRIEVRDLSNALADRAFAILMFLFALPNLVPFPLPGISVLLGIPLLFLSFQLMIGHKAPWFPEIIARRSFRYDDMKNVISYTTPYLKHIERFLKPRLSFMLSPFAERFIACICIVMAVMITLPIPLGNWFPALAICFFALAILERDGIFMILGIVISIVSVILVSTVLLTAFEIVHFFLQRTFQGM